MSDPRKQDEAAQEIRTEEPQAPFGEDAPHPDVVNDRTADEMGPGERTEPGLGGYADRDPATDTPLIPSVPETQDDPRSHDAKPGPGRERSASE